MAGRLYTGNEGFQIVAGFIRRCIFPQKEVQRCEERSRPAAIADCVTTLEAEGELKSKNEMCFLKDSFPLSFPRCDMFLLV